MHREGDSVTESGAPIPLGEQRRTHLGTAPARRFPWDDLAAGSLPGSFPERIYEPETGRGRGGAAAGRGGARPQRGRAGPRRAGRGKGGGGAVPRTGPASWPRTPTRTGRLRRWRGGGGCSGKATAARVARTHDPLVLREAGGPAPLPSLRASALRAAASPRPALRLRARAPHTRGRGRALGPVSPGEGLLPGTWEDLARGGPLRTWALARERPIKRLKFRRRWGGRRFTGGRREPVRGLLVGRGREAASGGSLELAASRAAG